MRGRSSYIYIHMYIFITTVYIYIHLKYLSICRHRKQGLLNWTLFTTQNFEPSTRKEETLGSNRGPIQ